MKLIICSMTAVLLINCLGCRTTAPHGQHVSSQRAEDAAVAAFQAWADVVMNGSRAHRTAAVAALCDAFQSTNKTTHSQALSMGSIRFSNRLRLTGTDSQNEFEESCRLVEVLIGDYRVARADGDPERARTLRLVMHFLAGGPLSEYLALEQWKNEWLKRQNWNFPRN